MSCDDLKWEFGDWYSVQTVGVHNALAKPGSATYQKWHEQVLKFRNGVPPEFGAIWMVYYPGLMIEWYPHVLVVSWLIPQGPQRRPTSSSSITPRKSRCSNASSSRPNAPPIWKRPSRTTRSRCGWTQAAVH